ncbi:MAG TPA: NAD(P)H-hydrate dehydratase [Spirochaetaceae bacterium]|nr:NAD(P)H-hydrate dehydratase [Spirochaetaceae bacterium]
MRAIEKIVLTDALAASLLPRRNERADKFAFGNALVIAGSSGLTGAPYFSAIACQRCGAGLVRLAVPSEIHAIVASKLNEVMVVPVPSESGMFAKLSEDSVMRYAMKSSAILIGPGIGVSEGTKGLVAKILKESSCPLVLDADALNCLAGKPELLLDAKCDIVVTPHEREFSRLFSFDRPPADDELVSLAMRYRIVIVYKSAKTRIASYDGSVYVNEGAANSGMAKGGSGDVLAGMILAFLSQGSEARQSAALAVRLHSIAGRVARERLTEYCMLPSDVIGCLPDAFRTVMSYL